MIQRSSGQVCPCTPCGWPRCPCPEPPATRWIGQPEGDEAWILDIDVDRFVPGGPLRVTLYTEYFDGTDNHAALVIASPAQARQMAVALERLAGLAEEGS